jgi:hypothetical protein
VSDDVKHDSDTAYRRGYEDCKRDLEEQRKTELEHHRLLTPWITLMHSLDRCEHGRHAIDDCWGTKDEPCTPLNRFLMIGQRIGTSYSGDYAIILPAPDVMTKPDEWKVPAYQTSPCDHCSVVIADKYMDLHVGAYCGRTANPKRVLWSRDGYQMLD